MVSVSSTGAIEFISNPRDGWIAFKRLPDNSLDCYRVASRDVIESNGQRSIPYRLDGRNISYIIGIEFDYFVKEINGEQQLCRVQQPID